MSSPACRAAPCSHAAALPSLLPRLCSQASSPSQLPRSSRRPAVRVRAAAQAEAQPAAAARVAQLKADIKRLSGSRYGHDLDTASKQAVVAKVGELEALQLPVKLDAAALTGTTWQTVFTTSDGTSSGKVGPFIADVEQVFPADAPGSYYNTARLGLVAAKLRGEFEATRADRIDLEFRDLVLCIGPWQAARKEFAPGAMRGYWRVSYCDADFRVFYTNKQNLFVLARKQ